MNQAAEFAAMPAEREAAPITACFTGQSGSGKTYSALLFARGLVGPKGRIVVIDTEGKRALIYADDPKIGGFHHVDFRAPYSSRRFQDAIRTQVEAGFHAIVIDSASHEHEAEGGLLDFADHEEMRLSQGDGRRVAQRKWIKPKAEHNRYMMAAISSPAHVIFCVREKRVLDVDAKPPVEKLEPVCEKNFMFEMMITIRLEPGSHRAQFIKVPEPFKPYIRDGELITVEHGALLMQEAGKGTKTSDDEARLERQIDALEQLARNSGTEAVKTAWDAMPQKDKEALKPKLNRLRELAADADTRIAAEEAEREAAGRQDDDHSGLTEDDPSDSFGF